MAEDQLIECSFCHESRVPFLWTECGKIMCEPCAVNPVNAAQLKAWPRQGRSGQCKCQFNNHEFMPIVEALADDVDLAIVERGLADRRQDLEETIAKYEDLRTRISQVMDGIILL